MNCIWKWLIYSSIKRMFNLNIFLGINLQNQYSHDLYCYIPIGRGAFPNNKVLVIFKTGSQIKLN